MKKLIKSLCSVFCVMNIALPIAAQPLAGEEIPTGLDERDEQSADSREGIHDYHLVLLTGDFSLRLVDDESRKKDPVGTLMLFVRSPEGRIIKDAQVVTTIIDTTGNQQMKRARPHKGGYVIGIDHLLDGYYRVEAEIVTEGLLLTDEFTFFKS